MKKEDWRKQHPLNTLKGKTYEHFVDFIQTLLKQEREQCRQSICPCACDMFIDEDGYMEAHSDNKL